MTRKSRNGVTPEAVIQNLISSLDKFASEGIRPSLTYLIQELLNYFMLKERQFYNEANSSICNGFYQRNLSLSFGNLKLNIPRVRFGNNFRSCLLPQRWKRYDKDYEEFLLALLSNGYTKAKIQEICKSLGIAYSEVAMQSIEELISQQLQYFKTRTLPHELFAVFIDAYNTDIMEEGKLKKLAIFTAVGIDLKGYKHILGYWIKQGSENLGFWTEVFQDLINRGLSKVVVFVTDNFSGLNKIIRKLFPVSDHQLCFLHFYRNLKGKLTLKSTKQIYTLWKKIKEAESYDEGLNYFNELVEFVRTYNPEYAQQIERQKENYLAFLKYPEEIRRHIYTTNIVESINSGIELMRREHGGYFHSYKMLETNLFIQLSNLHDEWMEKPNSKLAGASYELKQNFILKFELEKINEVVL